MNSVFFFFNISTLFCRDNPDTRLDESIVMLLNKVVYFYAILVDF